MPERTSKPRLVADVTIGGPRLDEESLRTLARNEPQAFAAKLQKLIDGGMRWRDVRNLLHTFRTLADIQIPVQVDVLGQQRAIMASAFPLLCGGLTVAGVNDAYEAVPSIGQDLVTDLDDNKKTTSLAQITSQDLGKDRTDEGHDFPEVMAGDGKFVIGSKRNGRRISVTAEAIEENDIANIAQRVDALGEIMGEFIEEQTLQRVCDLHGSASSAAEPYVLHNPTGTQLYNATANYPGTQAPSGTRVNNNALVDETDLENARLVLAAMKNTRGKRIAIPINRCTLLVPDALAGTALKILGSEMVSGVANELNNWGTRGQYRPRFRSSPKLDDISTTAWYLGWFEKQFVRKWKLRMEYVTLAGDTESFLRSRVAFQARVAWDCEIGARDYVYVVQSLSASTAPTAANVP